MFIICPKCSAKYRIPDDILLEKGQKLKCSACNHIFFKGDEAPLELGDFTSESVSETAIAQNEEAPFSTPMYRTEIAKISQKVNPLPEAFQPVESKQKQSLWLSYQERLLLEMRQARICTPITLQKPQKILSNTTPGGRVGRTRKRTEA